MSTPLSYERLRVARQFEDSGLVLMDRVVGANGAAITQSSISTIVLAIYEYASQADARNAANGTVVAGQGGSLTVSNVVYNTLQTAAPWTADSTGYNFRYDTDDGDMPNGGKWYRFEFKLTPATGTPFHVVWIAEALPLAGS